MKESPLPEGGTWTATRGVIRFLKKKGGERVPASRPEREEPWGRGARNTCEPPVRLAGRVLKKKKKRSGKDLPTKPRRNPGKGGKKEAGKAASNRLGRPARGPEEKKIQGRKVILVPALESGHHPSRKGKKKKSRSPAQGKRDWQRWGTG